MINLSNFYEDIFNHFELNAPQEGCGLFGVKKGKAYWIPCENIATELKNFQISSRDFIKARMSYDIIGVVHSHVDAPNTPSESDINYCNVLGIPFYIYSYPSMDLHILKPEGIDKPLSGRAYEFGLNDCFEASRDWYKDKGLDLNFRDIFESEWWLTEQDYFTPQNIKRWGFKQVNGSPQRGDFLVFAVDSLKGNHCGVYEGNDLFFHHARNRLSCRESIYPFWATKIIGIYRHEKNHIF